MKSECSKRISKRLTHLYLAVKNASPTFSDISFFPIILCCIPEISINKLLSPFPIFTVFLWYHFHVRSLFAVYCIFRTECYLYHIAHHCWSAVLVTECRALHRRAKLYITSLQYTDTSYFETGSVVRGALVSFVSSYCTASLVPK